MKTLLEIVAAGLFVAGHLAAAVILLRHLKARDERELASLQAYREALQLYSQAGDDLAEFNRRRNL